MLTTGMSSQLKIKVSEAITAESVGSGDCPVFATPSMIALVEKTAATLVSPHLAEGETSVGTFIDASHLAATPVGMEVSAEIVLKSADGRELNFDFKVFDEAGLIGEGTHTRFIVNKARFTEKANLKLNREE